jgi:hypothetical protein
VKFTRLGRPNDQDQRDHEAQQGHANTVMENCAVSVQVSRFEPAQTAKSRPSTPYNERLSNKYSRSSAPVSSYDDSWSIGQLFYL